MRRGSRHAIQGLPCEHSRAIHIHRHCCCSCSSLAQFVGAPEATHTLCTRPGGYTHTTTPHTKSGGYAHTTTPHTTHKVWRLHTHHNTTHHKQSLEATHTPQHHTPHTRSGGYTHMPKARLMHMAARNTSSHAPQPYPRPPRGRRAWCRCGLKCAWCGCQESEATHSVQCDAWQKDWLQMAHTMVRCFERRMRGT